VNSLAWQNDVDCADDVMSYQLYWSPVLGEALEPVSFFDDPMDLDYVWNEEGEFGTIAGCFAITALDSLMPGPDGSLRRNESALSDTILCRQLPLLLSSECIYAQFGWNERSVSGVPLEICGECRCPHLQPEWGGGFFKRLSRESIGMGVIEMEACVPTEFIITQRKCLPFD